MKRLWLFAPATLLALILVSSIAAANPGPGTSTGTGQVFVPNPVQSTGNENLTDQKDSDAAVPASVTRGARMKTPRSGSVSPARTRSASKLATWRP